MTWIEEFNFWKPHNFCIKENTLNFAVFMIQFMNKLRVEDGAFINDTNIIRGLRGYSLKFLAESTVCE